MDWYELKYRNRITCSKLYSLYSDISHYIREHYNYDFTHIGIYNDIWEITVKSSNLKAFDRDTILNYLCAIDMYLIILKLNKNDYMYNIYVGQLDEIKNFMIDY